MWNVCRKCRVSLTVSKQQRMEAADQWEQGSSEHEEEWWVWCDLSLVSPVPDLILVSVSFCVSGSEVRVLPGQFSGSFPPTESHGGHSHRSLPLLVSWFPDHTNWTQNSFSSHPVSRLYSPMSQHRVVTSQISQEFDLCPVSLFVHVAG